MKGVYKLTFIYIYILYRYICMYVCTYVRTYVCVYIYFQRLNEANTGEAKKYCNEGLPSQH